MYYTPRVVRSVLDGLFLEQRSISDVRADVVAGLSRLPNILRQALVLRAMGYTPAEIGRRVLGQDAWHVEGELLVTLAELELVVRLNKGGMRDDRGTVSGSGKSST